MKSSLRIIIAILAVCFMFAACSNADEQVNETSDLIDERALIEQAMEEQRELLKPGFIHNQPKNGFNLSFQSTTFDQETEMLTHIVNYEHAPSRIYLPLVIEKNGGANQYEETLKRFNEAQPLENNNGYYGYVEVDGEVYYQYIVEKDGATYYFENETSDSEELDRSLVLMMGESLKTEADGAYSYFYDQFAFKLDDLHFPQIEKAQVENVEIEIGDVGYWAYENSNYIRVTYHFGKHTVLHFFNSGMDLYTQNISYEKVNEEKTEGGQTVTTFDTEESLTVYYWEADGHHYAIELEMEDDAMSTKDIYSIIDSSREDTRTFSNENVFKNIYENTNSSQLDEKILQRLSEITD